MPASKLVRPQVKPQLLTGTIVNGDAVTSRLLSDLANAHDTLAAQVGTRNVITATLVAGANVINHGLGRKPSGAHVTPTVASTSFAWALTSSDAKQATITCVGPTQPNASIEVH